jgi:hypothetical protein
MWSMDSVVPHVVKNSRCSFSSMCCQYVPIFWVPCMALYRNSRAFIALSHCVLISLSVCVCPSFGMRVDYFLSQTVCVFPFFILDDSEGTIA